MRLLRRRFWGCGCGELFPTAGTRLGRTGGSHAYGQLHESGDAEIAALIAPQTLQILYTADGPTPAGSVQSELARARRFYVGLGKLEEPGASEKPSGEALAAGATKIARWLRAVQKGTNPEITIRVASSDVVKARNEQFEALHKYLRRLDAGSDATRDSLWKLLSTPPRRGCAWRRRCAAN